MSTGVQRLRTIVQEGIRVQRGNPETVEYVDATHALSDAVARQNHVLFGRRGCGKTLLLHEATKRVRDDVRVVYINCEDYKQHSFPNVLIEILDQLFRELEKNLNGWFGRKRRSRELIQEIRAELGKLKQRPDEREAKVRESRSAENLTNDSLKIQGYGLSVGTDFEALENSENCSGPITPPSPTKRPAVNLEHFTLQFRICSDRNIGGSTSPDRSKTCRR